MNGMEKSDSVVVAVKSANKGDSGPCGADGAKDRAQGESGKPKRAPDAAPGKRVTGGRPDTAIRTPGATGASDGASPPCHGRCVAPSVLRAEEGCAAAGADGMTWRMYEEGLEGRLADLHDRVHSGAYRATPSRRVNIPKPDGGTRPLGVAAIEDKIVQKAVTETILTPIYEAEFLGFSYGFRRGRGAHDALDALAVGSLTRRKDQLGGGLRHPRILR